VRNIVSSWTAEASVASNFGSIISEATVPIESVLSYHEYQSDLWTFDEEKEYSFMPGITEKQAFYADHKSAWQGGKHEEIPGKTYLDGVGYVDTPEKKSIINMVLDYLAKAKKAAKKKPAPKKKTGEDVPTEKELKEEAMEQIPSSTEGYGVYKPKDDKEKEVSDEYFGTDDEWKEAMKRNEERTGKRIDSKKTDKKP
jgi:hypothetical protein